MLYSIFMPTEGIFKVKPGEKLSSLNVTVIGNCQVQGFSSSISAMLPAANVYAINIGLKKEIQEIQPHIESSEIIFIQPNSVNELNKYKINANTKIVLFPNVTFSAFHPDIAYFMHNGAVVQSPIGAYHSSLILYGWKNNWSAEETRSLFCSKIYQHLGFFSHLEPAREALRKEGDACEIPIHDWVERWLQRGCFMYSINHPKLFVLADIAEAALKKTGFNVVRYAAEFVYDNLQNTTVWPVYTEIAERFGLEI